MNKSNKLTRLLLSSISAATGMVLFTTPALTPAQTRAKESAATYPVRPVRVVVPYSPGGSSDAVARILAAKLAESLGQQFIIDNRPGASGSLGRELVAKATPDGYTLLVGDSPHTINVHVLRHVPYDPIQDFTPITLLATAPQVLVLNPAFPAKTLKELIAAAKVQPGKLNYGSAAAGRSLTLQESCSSSRRISTLSTCHTRALRLR